MAATYSKPTAIPRWADTGTRTEPSGAKKNDGWTFEEAPPYGWENWLQGVNGDWWKWIDERIDDGGTSDTLIINQPGNGSAAWTCAVNANTFYEPTTINVSTSTLTNASGFTSNAKGNGTGVTGTGSGTGHGVQGTGSTGANSSGVTGTGSAITSGAGLIGVRGFGGNANSGNGGAGVYGLGGTENGGTPGPGGYFVAASGGAGCHGEAAGAGAQGLKGEAANGYGLWAQGDATSPTYAAVHIVSQNAQPSSLSNGDMWFDNSDNNLYCYMDDVIKVTHTKLRASVTITTGTPALDESEGCASVATGTDGGTGYTYLRLNFQRNLSSVNYTVQATDEYVSGNLPDRFWSVLNKTVGYVDIVLYDISVAGMLNLTTQSARVSVTVQGDLS